MGIQGPYPGDILEQATAEEFEAGFGCVPIDCKYILYFRGFEWNYFVRT